MHPTTRRRHAALSSTTVTLVALLHLGACASGPSGAGDGPAGTDDTTSMTTPPDAEKRPKVLRIHDHERVDDYYWMNQRDAPEVLAYLEAENRYAAGVLERTEETQEVLYQEFVARLDGDDDSVPVVQGPYAYFTRTREGMDYPIHCRIPSAAFAAEGMDALGTDVVEVLFDVNKLSRGHGFYAIGTRQPSPDHRRIAYAVDTVGRRKYDIEIKNLDVGDIARGISNTTGNVVWDGAGTSILYVKREPKTLRAYQVWRHVLDTPVSTDQLVYEESDPEFSCYVTKSRSEAYLMIVSRQTMASEVRICDAMDPAGEWTVVAPRERGHEYGVVHAGDRFLIRTNRGGMNFCLMSAPEDEPTRWEPLLPHRDDRFLQGVEAFAGHYVTTERGEGLVHLVVHSMDGGEPVEIAFDDPVYDVGTSGNGEFDARGVRYVYSSLTTPPSTFQYDFESGTSELIKRRDIGDDFDPANYVARRMFAEAEDGAMVPVSLVMRRDREPGAGPCLLYGYGSYGSSMDAGFNASVVSLLDRGFAYAIAHVRGGQELGRAWYEAGKLSHKKNTFTDFIACAEHLIAEGVTAEDRLFALGGSAGGLLIGAVANMRPDLWHGLVAAVPFVDVVTTMLDDTIPLTTSEYDEWGNPNERDAYFWMLEYSPYDQVEDREYPHMLVTTGYHDSQVQYFEPAKWVAKLRDHWQGDSLLVFDCEMEAGHGGVSGRFSRYRKTAEMYAFMLSVL